MSNLPFIISLVCGSSDVARNPLTRWDVSSIPANGIFNNTTNTSVIKHALVLNGWVGGWLGGVVVGGDGGGGRGAKAKVHSTFGVVCGVGGVGWVVVVVVVGGRRQRCIVPSGR